MPSTHKIRISFELEVGIEDLLRVLAQLGDPQYEVSTEEEEGARDPSPPPSSTGGPVYRDRDWLHEMYVVRGLTTHEVAAEAGCTQPTICDWIHRLGLPMRSHGGARERR